jgi:hypothetical protein
MAKPEEMNMKAKKTMNMRENMVFREIDEMLAGVHGELTDREILKRVAALVAGDPEMTAAAWLVRHARWYFDRVGSRFTGAVVTPAEATARGMRPARTIEVYKSRAMEALLVVQIDGQVILHTTTDGFPSALRPPEVRDEVVDMTDIARLDKQHPGKRLVKLVKMARAELGCAAA